MRQDKNDVLEVVYFIKNSQTYRVGKRNSGSIFVYRMGYSVEDVKDVPYVPAEYKDFEWSEQGESGEVFYTGDPAAQLISQHYVDKRRYGIFLIVLRICEIS